MALHKCVTTMSSKKEEASVTFFVDEEGDRNAPAFRTEDVIVLDSTSDSDSVKILHSDSDGSIHIIEDDSGRDDRKQIPESLDEVCFPDRQKPKPTNSADSQDFIFLSTYEGQVDLSVSSNNAPIDIGQLSYNSPLGRVDSVDPEASNGQTQSRIGSNLAQNNGHDVISSSCISTGSLSRTKEISFEVPSPSTECQDSPSQSSSQSSLGPCSRNSFVIDPSPSISSQEAKKHQKNSPQYALDLSLERDLEDVDGKIDESKKRRQQQFNPCFNCGGDHAVKDCRRPRNHAKIEEGRRALRIRSTMLSKRYHSDAEHSKYPHLQPGKISSKLRRALGLSRDQVPGYIYRMRIHGYPPGWLQEAKVEKSGLRLIESQEEGEVQDHRTPELEYDFDKIVEYPGFNVRLPRGYHEEGHKYDCPPQQAMNLKKNWSGFIREAEEKAILKRSLPPDLSAGKKATSLPMDLCSSDDETSSQDAQKEDLKPGGSRCLSPSLTDLELAKQQLIAELNEEFLTCTSEGKEELPALRSPPPTKLAKAEGQLVSTPLSAGALIPKSLSGLKQLPSSEKFQSNISDHLPYENLPDSTGTYDRMRELLKNVRKEMGVIHK